VRGCVDRLADQLLLFATIFFSRLLSLLTGLDRLYSLVALLTLHAVSVFFGWSGRCMSMVTVSLVALVRLRLPRFPPGPRTDSFIFHLFLSCDFVVGAPRRAVYLPTSGRMRVQQVRRPASSTSTRPPAVYAHHDTYTVPRVQEARPWIQLPQCRRFIF
jgi:hypothetical protein